MRLITAAEQRALDQLAAQAQLPTRTLMESAGAAVAQVVLGELARAGRGPHARVAVFCGPGNNGGDGYVAARLVREALLGAAGQAADLLIDALASRESGRDLASGLEHEPIVCVATISPERLKGDAQSAAAAWKASGGCTLSLDELARAGGRFAFLAAGDLAVDAVFGSGLSRDPAGEEARAIDALNRARARGARLIAVDVPSGLDADSGALYPAHVARADVTVTFHLPKRGLHLYPGAAVVGEMRVAPIGLPRALEAKLEGGPHCELLDEAWARRMLAPRSPTAHKQEFGHVLAIAGSSNKSGAAAMLCEAAMRAGAGLITLAARPDVLERVLPSIPEAMGFPLPGPAGDSTAPLSLADLPALLAALRGKTALAAGPGIARGPETGPLFGALLAELDPGVACVLDADALNALAEHRDQIAAWCGKPAQRPVLTPHAAEFARLTGETVEAVESDRLGAATRAAVRFSCTMVLKGARTVIADPSGAAGICGAGNPGMATAGSGDVLTGITAALLARRGGPGTTFERAQLAVLLHALAGDEAVALASETGLIATDLVRAGLPRVLHRLAR